MKIRTKIEHIMNDEIWGKYGRYLYLVSLDIIKPSIKNILESISPELNDQIVLDFINGNTWREKKVGVLLAILREDESVLNEILEILYSECIYVKKDCITYVLLLPDLRTIINILSDYYNSEEILNESLDNKLFTLAALKYAENKLPMESSISIDNNFKKYFDRITLRLDNVEKLKNNLGR